MRNPFKRCKHPDVWCIHGDGIITAGYRRGWCYDCGRLLKPLPVVCAWTGQPHPSLVGGPDA